MRIKMIGNSIELPLEDKEFSKRFIAQVARSLDLHIGAIDDLYHAKCMKLPALEVKGWLAGEMPKNRLKAEIVFASLDLHKKELAEAHSTEAPTWRGVWDVQAWTSFYSLAFLPLNLEAFGWDEISVDLLEKILTSIVMFEEARRSPKEFHWNERLDEISSSTKRLNSFAASLKTRIPDQVETFRRKVMSS